MSPRSCSLLLGLQTQLTAVILALIAPVLAAVTPLAQDYTIVFHNPDSEQYVEGCGLVRLDDGTLVAAVPVVPRAQWSKDRRMERSAIHIVRSTDRGRTWNVASELRYYSAVPWTHQGRLYLFANKPGTEFRNDDLLLLRSDDGGQTWSSPVTLFPGHFWNCHTGMVQRPNQLYWAIDDLSFGMQQRGPRVVAGDLSGDPMQPAAWRLSNPVPFPGFPASMRNPRFADRSSQYLECNVVEVNGRIRLLGTVKPHGQSTTNVGGVLDLQDNGRELALSFTQFHPLPGGHLKFCVIRDEVSGLFWATANFAVDGQGTFDWWKEGGKAGRFQGSNTTGGNDRRFLMLLYSLDALNWFQAGCVAQAQKISQSFMYGKLTVDGDDLAIIARTSIRAPNQHDADHATFHRVKNFRSLALNLKPQPEN
jgi:hypothetical protein